MPKHSGATATSTPAPAANGTLVPLPPHRKTRRFYKDAPNKNNFSCHGRLITGPDRKYFWAAFCMIIVPCVAFLAAVYVLFRTTYSSLYRSKVKFQQKIP
jgi:hypothetical protein